MPSSLPFWDPGAAQQSGVTTQGGQVTSAQTTYPGIQTFLPELSSQPLPDSVSPWEVIYFAGIRAPGVCRVDGGRRRIVDRIGIPGSSGEIARTMGYGLFECTITLRMWTAQHWFQWQNLVNILFPKPQPAPQQSASQLSVAPFLVQPNPLNPLTVAFDVKHPLIQSYGVGTVYITEIDGPRPVNLQELEARIGCIELLAVQREGAQVISASDSGPRSSSQPTTSTARTLPPDPSQTNIGP